MEIYTDASRKHLKITAGLYNDKAEVYKSHFEIGNVSQNATVSACGYADHRMTNLDLVIVGHDDLSLIHI